MGSGWRCAVLLLTYLTTESSQTTESIQSFKKGLLGGVVQAKTSSFRFVLRIRGGSAVIAEQPVLERAKLEDEHYNLTFLASTAGSIAAFRAAVTALNSSFIEDPYAAMFARETNNEKLQAILAKPYPELARLAVRTYFFDDFIRDAVFRHGIRQVVLIGAGFDARALRGRDMLWHQLEEPKARDILEGRGLTFYELDLPGLMTTKAALLRKMGMTSENSRVMKLPKVNRIGVDIMKDDWISVLRRYGFYPDRPSCILLEGFLYYFDEKDVNRTMSTLNEICAPGSRIGLSAVSAAGTAKAGGRSAFRWGTDEPEEYMRSFGWTEPDARELGDPSIANGFPMDNHPPPRPREEAGLRRTWYLTATKPYPPKSRAERIRDSVGAFFVQHRPAAEAAFNFLTKALTSGHQIRIPLPSWLSLH